MQIQFPLGSTEKKGLSAPFRQRSTAPALSHTHTHRKVMMGNAGFLQIAITPGETERRRGP